MSVASAVVVSTAGKQQCPANIASRLSTHAHPDGVDKLHLEHLSSAV